MRLRIVNGNFAQVSEPTLLEKMKDKLGRVMKRVIERELEKKNRERRELMYLKEMI